MTTTRTPEPCMRGGQPLVCPHCDNKSFYTRRSLLNTPGLAFFSLDWLNKESDNYICSNCGHILWFVDVPPQ